MCSTRDDYMWYVHSVTCATRISGRGIQLGNQLDKGYDHASGSITASEYDPGTLDIEGIGSPGKRKTKRDA